MLKRTAARGSLCGVPRAVVLGGGAHAPRSSIDDLGWWCTRVGIPSQKPFHFTFLCADRVGLAILAAVILVLAGACWYSPGVEARSAEFSTLQEGILTLEPLGWFPVVGRFGDFDQRDGQLMVEVTGREGRTISVVWPLLAFDGERLVQSLDIDGITLRSCRGLSRRCR